MIAYRHGETMGLFDALVTKESLRMVAYTSDCMVSEEIVEPAFYGLASQSFVSNEARAINSVLFYDQHRFYQYIEGPEQAVRTLLQTIEKDPRHCRLKVLAADAINARTFECTPLGAYFLGNRVASDDPSYIRMKRAFKELGSWGQIDVQSVVGFTRAMAREFDPFDIMRL